MKRLFSVLLCFIFLLAIAGCSKSSVSSKDESSEVVFEEVVSTEEETIVEEADNKILVVYFSRTGNTKALAEYAIDYYSADSYEILALEPYSDEDINYNDSSSRTSKEQNDKSVRPAIDGNVANFDQYDTIILGYPIWWGQAPRIIDTFVESYDFSGKAIIPFCTSASSGIGNSDSALHDLVKGNVTWISGKRFAIGTAKEEFCSWLEQVCPSK